MLQEDNQPGPASTASGAGPLRATLVSVAVFALKWAVAGLAFVAMLLWLRPDLRNSAPAQSAPIEHAEQSHSASLATTARVAPDANVPTPSIGAPPTYADAVARSAPAVVNVFTARVVTERTPAPLSQLFGGQPQAVRQRIEGSLGSGVIVDGRGHVVTNHHVIENAQKIRLQLADGRIADATVVGDDPETDLALLKIQLSSLPVMQLGRSDRLRVGDVTLAIGYPYGLSQTVTHGIVSATGRDELGLTPFESFIQTDAAINVGNSGGALINAQGELIGINTAVLAQGGTATEGIGFAIPVNMVRGVVEQILKYGHVRRGWLGVTWQPLTTQRAAAVGLTDTAGVEIVEVDADSPAAQAGLHRGDVLTALNGQPVRDGREALHRVAGLKPASRLRVQGRGTRGMIDATVTIAERPVKPQGD